MKNNIFFSTLNNKLNLIFIEDKSTDLIMSTVNISVGSNMETPEISGICHLKEHILFHNKFKNMDITKYLHQISALYNASTSYDQTNYYIISNKNDCCESLDMLYTIYIHNSFTNDDLIKEKRIVMEEHSITYNNLNSHVHKALFKSLFGKDVSENLFVIGTEKAINNASKNDIVQYKKYYLPELTTLIIVGNFNKNIILNTINKTFGKVKNNFNLSKQVLNNHINIINNKQQFNYYSVPGQNQCYILFAFQSYNYNNKNKFAVDVLKNLLNYFILFEKLRLDAGQTYSSKSSIFSNKDIGLFCVDCQVDFRYLMPVLKTLAEIFKSLKTEFVEDNLLKRTYKKLKINNNLTFQDFRSYHTFYNQQCVNTRDFKNIISPSQYLEYSKSITKYDIKKVANFIFDSKKTNLVIVGPEFRQSIALKQIFNYF
tara:strand:- start:51 stop:1337 length:1287 start_codon:yes stop_codon:yes gene_type:complete